MNKNHLFVLESFAQSFWLDYLGRNALNNGEFEQLIYGDGASGLTSNALQEKRAAKVQKSAGAQ